MKGEKDLQKGQLTTNNEAKLFSCRNMPQGETSTLTNRKFGRHDRQTDVDSHGDTVRVTTQICRQADRQTVRPRVGQTDMKAHRHTEIHKRHRNRQTERKERPTDKQTKNKRRKRMR